MARSAVLNVAVLVDAAQAAAGFNQAGSAAEGFGKDIAKAAAALGGMAAITGFGKQAVEAASKLQQSMGGVEAVFKGSAGQVKAWGAQAATSLGLSQSAYQDLATLIGSQLKNAGVSMDELAPKTDNLIRQGADMAAMYGGTTAEAVDALSSALKGERDPIEKYGVTLSQAAVDAEIMALGLDTTTTAAKQNATAMATMSLITKQTADSQGAAAREADSYASVMQSLGAVWENTLAAVGSALLPAITGVASGLQDMLPAVSSLLTPIAELVGWVLQLPTPLLAAAAAVGLWMKFGGPISAAVTAFASSVRTATGSMAGFKAAVGGIASSLAGGLAFAGITVAIMAIAQAFQRSSQAAATATEAYQPVVDAIVASKGAWSDAAAAAQNNAILTSGAFKGLIEAGFGADQAVKILLGTQEEWIAVQSDGSDATRNLTKDTSAAVDGMIDANGAAGKLAQAQLEGAVAIDAQTGATQANSAATKEAADAQQKASEEAAKAAVEAAKTAAAQTGVKVALDSVKTAASEASTAVDFYVLSMQQAAGMNVTTDQAAKLLNDTMRGTAEAFKASSDANNLNKAALTTWNVAVLTSTEQGSSLYDALIKQQSGFAAVTTAAFSAIDPVTGVAGGMTAAAAAADTAYQAFITMATGAGLSGSEAEQLAGKLGIVQGVQLDPKTFDLIVQDQQADQALADAQAAEIAAKSFDITANPAPAVEQMDATAAGAPDATIVADANTASADAGLKTSANQKLPATVTASANTAVADSQLSALVSQARTITIQVEANISPAAVMINQLVALTRTATITVTANTSSFDQTMRDITNRSYSATVTVTANTSAATASIAAVPRSVAVPPPAAPALRGATQQSTQVATSNINYNVTLKGGITDPDGAARAIVQVLEGRARRSTTVIAR